MIKTELASYLGNADCAILRLPSMLGLFSLQICKEKNIPYLIEVVGDAFDSYYNYGSIIGRIAAPIYDFLNKKAILKSRYTLYVTQEYLQKRYPSSIGGKSIGITDAVIYPIPEEILQKRLDKINRFSSNSVKCGQIGNVSVRYKGYHIMLKALAILKRNGIFPSYHIVGGGEPSELLSEARKLGVEEMVVVRGKLSHEEVESFLDEIDIYVHPSFQEGLPRVVVEAISRACPCLTSNVAGTPELLNAKCLHNCGDYKKLAQDLRRMIMNRDEMKEVAIENYNHAKEYYYPKLESERRAFFESFFSSVKNERSFIK